MRGGVSGISETQLSKSRLERARSRLREAQAKLKEAQANYKRVVGLSVPMGVSSWPVLPHLHVRSAYEVWCEAKRHNPTLLASHDAMLAARAGVGVANAAFYPKVSFEMRGQYGHDLNAEEGRDDQLSALLVGEYNLLSGGSDSAQVQSEKARAIQTRYALLDSMRTIRNQAYKIWGFKSYDGERLKHLQDHERQAKTVWHSYRKEFDLGHRTLFDMLNAETEYYNARISRINGQYNWMLDHFQLLAVMGRLVHYFDSTHPTASL